MSYITANELADLIEKGLKVEGVVEDPMNFLVNPGGSDKVHACALGLAYIGLIGDAYEAEKTYWKNRTMVGSADLGFLLNVPYPNCLDISYDHFMGDSAEQIISKLRKGEYEWNRSLNE